MSRQGLAGLIVGIAVLWGSFSGTAAEGGAADLPTEPRTLQPQVGYALRHDTSPPLAELALGATSPRGGPAVPLFQPFPPERKIHPAAADPVVQAFHGPFAMPAPLVAFEGLGNTDNVAQLGSGVLPPDPNGAAGPNHYLQIVNLTFAIWLKDGTRVFGPAPNNLLWAGLGGLCETSNNGDPIVLYDHLSGRWFVSQFALRFWTEFHQCIAVSATSDPTGPWHRYDFLVSSAKMNDYPKFGLWPDGYYLTVNQFDAHGWAGQGVGVFERDAMLEGLPARLVFFDLYEVNPLYGALLPASLDGPPPPAGAPNVFGEMAGPLFGYSDHLLHLWNFHVDWAAPENATFGLDGHPSQTLYTAPFDANLCAFNPTCIPQPDVGPASYVDAISDRLMFRLAYRHFPEYDAMVVNHTVDVDLTDHAGIRWYELHNPGSGWEIARQGTFAPDSNHRWMASAALDAAGNLALGYSISSEMLYPSIRYAGRLAGDPASLLTYHEAGLATGGGSQKTTIFTRWGDYSALTLDPTDDCTFWYTQEYYETSSNSLWQTRIGAFRFPSCTNGPTGSVAGIVTDAANGAPLVGARVTTPAAVTLTDETGTYRFLNLEVGSRSLTVTLFGYAQSSAPVSLSPGGMASQDFALSPLPTLPFTATVTDGVGQGWPLFAGVTLRAGDYAHTVSTDPATGQFSLGLLENVSYTLEIEPYTYGYGPAVFPVTTALPSGTTFPLEPAASCETPGYTQDVRGIAYREDFEASAGGFTATQTTSWAWGQPTSGPGEAQSGLHVWATNLAGDYSNQEEGYLVSPSIDLSPYAGEKFTLSWWQWLATEKDYDFARFEISVDGGQTWSALLQGLSGEVDPEWTPYTFYLDESFAVAAFRLRASLRADAFVTEAGYYLDSISITRHVCAPQAGGLLVGQVLDGVNGLGVNGATVTKVGAPNEATTSYATPEAGGFYTLFVAEAGVHTFAAAKPGFFPDVEVAEVAKGGVRRRDFILPNQKIYWPVIYR